MRINKEDIDIKKRYMKISKVIAYVLLNLIYVKKIKYKFVIIRSLYE